jgi:hypothetical protein
MSKEDKLYGAFYRVLRNTLCPFAPSARIYWGPTWDRDQTFESNIHRVADTIEDFCRRVTADMLDAFVMELALGPRLLDFSYACEMFAKTLDSLSALDPNRADCLAGDFYSPAWQFEFAGVRLFLSVFAPCYPADHTRHIHENDRMYLLFQPDESFDRILDGRDRSAVRRNIRQRFLDNGRPYRWDVIDGRIEALIYMLPAGSEPAVRWWK